MITKFEIAVRQAAALGHAMTNDPTSLNVGVRRYSCARCARAVLGYENGTCWGSALDKPCDVKGVP